MFNSVEDQNVYKSLNLNNETKKLNELKTSILILRNVLDGETKVADVIQKLSKDLNKKINITQFVRFNLGEGIEKETKNFADEVADQLSS